MRFLLTIAFLVASIGASASDSLRSDKHFVKIDTQSLSGASRQYNLQVFDGESRQHVAHLKVVTNGNEPGESETTAGGKHYKAIIATHGTAYLIAFTADDGNEVIDSMRGGFLQEVGPKPSANHAPPRAGRDLPEPALLRRIEPVYTDDARAAGAAGTVVLEVRIDTSGFVREATVLKPMGYGLSESAVDAVKQWQFAPSMQERRPVEVSHEVTIEFKP